MIKTIFYLKSDKENNKGESAIYAKISLRGKSTTLATGKYISKERWDFTNKLKNTVRLNPEKVCQQTLERLDSKIESIYLELSKNNYNVTPLEVKNNLTGKTEKIEGLDILKLFDKHNNFFQKRYNAGERSKASLQKYKRARDLIASFIKVKYFKTTFPLIEIDNKFIYSLEDYLKYESSFNGKKGISHNSVVKYFQCFSTMCNYGIKHSIIKYNPFSVYDEKLIITDAVFLTKEELQRIENKEFETDRLNKVKDIFLFSCYTSYAPCDVEKLTKNNLIRDNEGVFWIKTNRAKTNTKSNVPLIPPAKRILDKYEYLDEKKLLPKISNQKINEYLKEIATLCKINKKLTHYVARHTFATTITLGNGVSLENVSSMMGHTRITMTQHYAKVLDENVKNDMEKLKHIYS
ncbi:site-specific integrase [Aestuariibaculum sp. M13]|uniref:site-specific integrase n=1 Tax=Aestuariibaculum sp. M13 TaxID=2967132 RepID=UPI002159EC13|nr:site-specific integrase [Aestuariibaculum sp. M13]MCR8667936.1 site-specific integrase [Aestuariibaculum sp. M13]